MTSDVLRALTAPGGWPQRPQTIRLPAAGLANPLRSNFPRPARQAGFSVFAGLLALRRGGSEDPLIAYVVLAVAAVAEGISLVRVLAQFRGEARRSDLEVLDHVRSSPDTTVKAEIDRRLADRLPLVPHVFLDPTQTPSGSQPAGLGSPP